MEADRVQGRTAGPQPQVKVPSETQRQLGEMRPGEAWSHEAVARGYQAGGNQGEFTDRAPDAVGEEEHHGRS